MQSVSSFAILLLLVACAPVSEESAREEPVGDPLPATMIPVPSSEDRAASAGWQGGRPWMAQHEDICAVGRDTGLELVFLGDSITQSWGGPGRKVGVTGGSAWREFYASRKAANFGISGDRTQHVLWRIQNGALDGIAPKVVVLLIGTNNIGTDDAGEIAMGVREIERELRERLPETRLLVLGLLPRGGPKDEARTTTEEVNRRLASMVWYEGSAYLDLAQTFCNKDGSLRTKLYSGDGLHLAPAGYRVWASAIEPIVSEGLD